MPVLSTTSIGASTSNHRSSPFGVSWGVPLTIRCPSLTSVVNPLPPNRVNSTAPPINGYCGHTLARIIVYWVSDFRRPFENV